jgi:hypothetical protein
MRKSYKISDKERNVDLNKLNKVIYFVLFAYDNIIEEYKFFENSLVSLLENL